MEGFAVDMSFAAATKIKIKSLKDYSHPRFWANIFYFLDVNLIDRIKTANRFL